MLNNKGGKDTLFLAQKSNGAEQNAFAIIIIIIIEIFKRAFALKDMWMKSIEQIPWLDKAPI